jgi:hypothetical protein
MIRTAQKGSGGRYQDTLLRLLTKIVVGTQRGDPVSLKNYGGIEIQIDRHRGIKWQQDDLISLIFSRNKSNKLKIMLE